MTISTVSCPACKGKLVAESVSLNNARGLSVKCGVHGELAQLSMSAGGRTETLSEIITRVEAAVRGFKPAIDERFKLQSVSIMRDGSFGVAGRIR